MHVRERVRQVMGFMGRHRRAFALAAVLLLLMGPLPLTGNVAVLVLNAVGLAWVGLLLLRLTGYGNRDHTATTTRRRTR